MKINLEDALKMVAAETVSQAPAPPPSAAIELRVRYARLQRRQAARARLQWVTFAALAGVATALMVFWNGEWMREAALLQLAALVTGGSDALGTAIPAAALFVAGVIVVLVADDLFQTRYE